MSKIIDVINGLENLLPLKPASVEAVENVKIELAFIKHLRVHHYILPQISRKGKVIFC